MNQRTYLRIAVTGPESTGKTTVCRYLAGEYGTVFIPEYARTYLEEHEGRYSAADIPQFYRVQMDQELKVATGNNKPIFIDTEFSNASIWYRSLTGKSHEWIQKMLDEHRYDLYLLMKTDIEWEPDPLRENPETSEYYFNEFLKIMEQMNFNFRVISGSGDERFRMAKDAVEELIGKQFPYTE
jgi:NadR type nicotinamide-nucleotide adenylyltransferase